MDLGDQKVSQNYRSREWKWSVLATVGITLLAIYPQLNLWLARGGNWGGSYVLVQGDEDAYSAYINALIEGRPRRNDPQTGRDDAPGSPQPESLFSIQLIPAYVIAWPARFLGLSTSTAFIILIILAAMASSLAIFRLVVSVTGDERLAAAGVVFVLCLGTLVATQGVVRTFLGTSPTYSFFPFLRRYQPAVPFPLFFVFCLFVWRGLTDASLRRIVLWAAAAGSIFAVLVFSYFYLWTAAAGWLAGLVTLWVIWQPATRRRVLLVCGIISTFALAALVPYFILISHRDPNMDKVQLLTLSHAPDLFRVSELIGLASLAALFILARRGVIEGTNRATIFVASLGAMPLIVFNQQVITGRSMQPLHYELFISNYVSLLAMVMTVALIQRGRKRVERKIPGRALALATLLAFGWGVLESTGAAKLDVNLARLRDDAMPVTKRLAELAKTDGTLNARPGGNDLRPVVFSSPRPLADCLPTGSPQASLWALHMDAFPGASPAERKERFYQYLYYSGTTSQELEQSIIDGRFSIMVALFGVERVIPGLVENVQPLQLDEMRREWLAYGEYAASFSRERAAKPTLSYVVVPTEAPPELSNLDRWYEREPGERVGLFTIYRVRLRP